MHTAEYLRAFNTGTLDEARMRRIGFGEVARSGVLIHRTKAEVAGVSLTHIPRPLSKPPGLPSYLLVQPLPLGLTCRCRLCRRDSCSINMCFPIPCSWLISFSEALLCAK